MEDVRSLGLRENRSGRLLSITLSHSLASTSQAEHVNLYGFKINGLDPAQFKQIPQKTRFALMKRVHFPWA
jgi:hypothetical protein